MSTGLTELILGVMLTALLGLSSWTLLMVHRLATRDAARQQKAEAQDQQLREDRARIMECEQDVGDLKVKVATLEERTGGRCFTGD